MTGVAVDWLTLSTPEFVAWTRLVGVALPFPLSSGALSYVAGPDAEEMAGLLSARDLTTSPVLAAARSALAEPRLAVYAVRATIDAAETKYFAVAGHDDAALLVLLDDHQVALRTIADTELAAGVVGALPAPAALRFEPCEVSVDALRAVDAAIESGVSPRTLRATMSHVGFPPELIALREQVGNSAATSGALGAMAYAPGGQPRHSARSATWREYEDGAFAQVERGARQGRPIVALTPWTPDALFRAAIDAVASLYGDGA